MKISCVIAHVKRARQELCKRKIARDYGILSGEQYILFFDMVKYRIGRSPHIDDRLGIPDVFVAVKLAL
jgi:hypothetical protein